MQKKNNMFIMQSNAENNTPVEVVRLIRTTFFADSTYFLQRTDVLLFRRFSLICNWTGNLSTYHDVVSAEYSPVQPITINCFQ
jgi:hypothetical protein